MLARAGPQLSPGARRRILLIDILIPVLALGRVHVRELAADEEPEQRRLGGDPVVQDGRGRGGGLGQRALEEGEGRYGTVCVARCGSTQSTSSREG